MMNPQKIPEGYKLTEVGIIPSDWDVSNIEHISLVPMQNGLFYEPKRKGKGIPLINVGDMYVAAPIDVTSLALFDATHNEIKSFKVQRGDLFFTRSSIVPSGIAYCNIFYEESTVAVFDSHLIRVRPDPKVMNANFLYLNCIANHSRKFLISSAKTATMTTIDQGAIKNCPVLVPPKKEQIAIANALSDVDALITSLEKLIAKKSAIKTAAMQQLLTGKKRLPPFDQQHTGYQQTELGEIPEDWEVKPIREIIIGTQLGGNYLNTEVETAYPLIKMGNLGRGNINLSKLEYVQGKVENRDLLKKGDVLFNTRNTLTLVGKVSMWRNELPVAYFNSNILRFKFDESVISSNEYVNAAMNTKRFVSDLAGIATGTTSVAAIYTRDLLQLNIVLPPNKEQTAIANVLSEMDDEISLLQQRLNKTKQIKQGMMQELLTGKTRLVLVTR
jgi:type I restriction enzyme S subunit